jgi:hypothetical protein
MMPQPSCWRDFASFSLLDFATCTETVSQSIGLILPVIILDTWLSWSTQIVRCRKIGTHTLGVFGPLLNRRSGLYIKNGVLLYEQLMRASGGPPLAPTSGNCWCFNPSDFALLPLHFGTLVTDKFMKILEFHSLPNTSDLYPEIWLQVSWYGKRVSWATWQIPVLAEGWPSSTKLP